MNTQAKWSLEECIDAQPLSPKQLLIALLCFIAVLLDGFDSILIGFIAPAIKHQWGLAPSQLATLFGAGVVGLMCGAIAIGPCADRFGRKTVLVASVASFGILTLAGAAAQSLHVLVALRFLAGLGLGAAMPGAITLTSEFCPRRFRSVIVTTMFCGFTGGAAISGILAAWLVSDLGWRAVLIAGGVAPLVLVPFMLIGLPESVRYLALRDDAQGRIVRILKQIAPGADPDGIVLRSPREQIVRFPVSRLFARNVKAGTFIIWTVYFANLLVLLFLNSWLPTLLLGLGIPLIHASLFVATFQLGGTAGSIGLGYVMDRWNGCYVLVGAFVVGAIALLCVSSVGTATLALAPVLFLVGIGTGGAQTGAHVVTSSYYETASRATGMSWALGIGRIGSVIGSMAGSYMLAGHWTQNAIFGSMAGILFIAAAGMFVLSRNKHRRAATQNGQRTEDSLVPLSPISAARHRQKTR